jgi:hypothetical protein
MSTTPPCDCLNVCFDDERVREGRARPCKFGARQLAENRCTEDLKWVNPTQATMPEAYAMVLLEREADGKRMSVVPGYWDGTVWRCGTRDDELVPGKVTGWAAWPVGRVGGARHG